MNRRFSLNDHAFSTAATLLAQRARASDFLFHHGDCSRVRSARESFDTLVKRALLDEVIPYTLRHKFGAWSVKAEIQPRVLPETDGHNYPGRHGAILAGGPGRLAAAVNRLDSF